MARSSTKECGDNRYSLSIRPITDAERKVAVDSVKPARYRTIVMSVIGIITAIVVNFGTDIFLLTVPLLFAMMAGSAAFEYKKNSEAIAKSLAAGTVPEIVGIPAKKRFRGVWTIGPLTFANKEGIAKTLQEGVPSRVAILPAARIAVSVNGMSLKKALPIENMPRDFGQDLTIPPEPPQSVIAPPQQTPYAHEDLPPPPDDWEWVFCGACGQRNPNAARFCSKCGTPIKR